jgi:toxin FitB
VNYLIDTCVISELVKDSPDANVLEYINNLIDSDVMISVITIGELKNGISNLAKGKRRSKLEKWLNEEMLVRFDGRILNIDTDIMLVWGELVSTLSSVGRPMPIMDSLLAAQCKRYELKLITRNTKDFDNTGIKLINPWQLD